MLKFDWNLFRERIELCRTNNIGGNNFYVPLSKLAETCGVFNQTLWNVVVGKKTGIDNILKICDGLKLSLNDFIVDAKPAKRKK